MKTPPNIYVPPGLVEAAARAQQARERVLAGLTSSMPSFAPLLAGTPRMLREAEAAIQMLQQRQQEYTARSLYRSPPPPARTVIINISPTEETPPEEEPAPDES